MKRVDDRKHLADDPYGILHVDMDSFYAAVEQRENPELRGRPVIVGAPPDRRGVVSAASYEARRFGVHSAMPSSEAGRLCPHGVFLPVRGDLYRRESKRIFAVFQRYTPLVEGLSIDEAFLDVRGARRLFGDGRCIARRIRADISGELNLTASVGVAPNKFLAKLASDINKPDGLTVCPPGAAALRAFLAPLPIERIWGIGPTGANLLHCRNIHTFEDLREADPVQLNRWLGSGTASVLKRLARGEDNRPVITASPRKSISRETTFEADLRDAQKLRATLLSLADEVGQRLRRRGLYAGVVRLKVRWSDFRTVTRQRRPARPCADNFTLREEALRLWDPLHSGQRVRLIGFGAGDLRRGTADQLSLFEEDRLHLKRERLSAVIDSIRDRFGESSIR